MVSSLMFWVEMSNQLSHSFFYSKESLQAATDEVNRSDFLNLLCFAMFQMSLKWNKDVDAMRVRFWYEEMALLLKVPVPPVADQYRL